MAKLIEISLSDVFKTCIWGLLFLASLMTNLIDKTEDSSKIHNERLKKLEISVSKVVSPNGYIYPSPTSSKALTEIRVLQKEIEYLRGNRNGE